MSKYKDDETKSGNTLGQFIRQSMDPIEEEAIKSIKSIYENLIVQQKYSEKAVNGKNKTIRDNNALKAVLQSWKILKELKPWNEVIKAKENGVIIDNEIPPLFEGEDHDKR